MNAFWQFLQSEYPTAASAADSQNWLAALPQYGFVAVAGVDSKAFLQGQTSCDWRQITEHQASFGSCCNLKGRVISSFLAGMHSADSALLRVAADIAETTRSTLAKYAVFSKVELKDCSGERIALGVCGPKVKAALQRALGTTPEGLFAQALVGDTLIVQLDSAGQRFECWLSPEDAIALFTSLSSELAVVDGAAWERENILAGLVDIRAATVDQFLPQQLNYHLSGAVNFKKGCYTGQEVVARLHYRGVVKRPLFRIALSTGDVPCPGADIVSAEDGRNQGTIVSGAANPSGAIALAVIAGDAIAKPLQIQADGQTLSIDSIVSLNGDG